MTPSLVKIRELAAWGFDDGSRGDVDLSSAESQQFVDRARSIVRGRTALSDTDAVVHELTASERSRYSHHLVRKDIQAEYAGLRWTIAVVDLRKLIAFQRRIILDADRQLEDTTLAGDWGSLLHLAFDGTRSTAIHRHETQSTAGVETIEFRSWNPDLQLRIDPAAGHPVQFHGGSPLFEVAHYRGRWFLRDGYHRAFRLLQAGIHAMFAIIVEARTMSEVGAVHPWFFDEETLFSEHPPMVTDFHNNELVLQYSRTRMIKRITVRIEETLHPADEDDCAALKQTEERR